MFDRSSLIKEILGLQPIEASDLGRIFCLDLRHGQETNCKASAVLKSKQVLGREKRSPT